MQVHRAGRDTLRDPGIGHQVLQRYQDGGLLARPRLQGGRLVGQLGQYAIVRPLRDADPLADEFAARSGSTHQGVDATALGMTEHDDVLDGERQHGEFQRRRYAGEAAARLIGRHQIRHVTHHEDIAWFRPHQDGWVHPGVGAGHDERLRLLPLPQPLEQGPVLAEVLFLEAPETGDKTGDVLHKTAPARQAAMPSASGGRP